MSPIIAGLCQARGEKRGFVGSPHSPREHLSGSIDE